MTQRMNHGRPVPEQRIAMRAWALEWRRELKRFGPGPLTFQALERAIEWRDSALHTEKIYRDFDLIAQGDRKEAA